MGLPASGYAAWQLHLPFFNEKEVEDVKGSSLIIKIVLLMSGLVVMALGTAATIHAGLGTSPPSSPAYVLSLRFTKLTVGTWMFLWGIMLLGFQLLIKRRQFQFHEFLQIPVALIYGTFVDLWSPLISYFPVDAYWKQALLQIIACFILALGVTLTALSGLAMNSADSTAKAIAEKLGKEFGTLKIAVDVCHVIFAVLFSLTLLGTLMGVREGTLIAAVLPGFIIRMWMPCFRVWIEKRMPQ